MADNFGLKIGIEGEREFKKALSDINQSFKVLGSEMNLVTSRFDKNDRSVEALTSRNQVLNKEIDTQKAKIDTLEKALQNAAASFGENDKRTQAWQIKLNNARAELNRIGKELDDNNAALDDAAKGFDKAGKEADDFGDEVKNAADNADDAGSRFNALGSVVKGVGVAMAAVFAAISAAAVSAGKALVDMTKEGAAFADDVLTLSAQTGIATDKLQEYKYASELVDVSVETLTSSMAKQIKSMKAAQDGTALSVDAYDRLGVSVMNTDGTLRDSDTVYWEIIEALGRMENETERDALAMQLLGRSAQELNPLIEAGAERMNELGQQARAAGYVMSEEMLAAYGALDDQLQYLSVGATAAKNALGTVLLPVLTDLAGTGTELLGQFAKGVQDANGDIGKITDLVGELLPQFLDKVISFIPEIAGLVMEIIGAFGTAILDNLPLIIEAAAQIMTTLLEGLMDALPQLADGALQLLMALADGIIKHLPKLVDVAIKVISKLASGLASALPKLVPTIVKAMVLICETLIDNLDLLLDAALQIIVGLANGLLDALPELIAALPVIITGIVDFIIGAIPQIIDAGIQLLVSLVDALPEIIAAIVEAIPQIIDGIITAILDSIPLLIQAGIDLLVALIHALPDIIIAIVAAIPEIIDGIITALIDSLPLLIEAGVDLFIALIENLPTIIVEIVKAVPEIIAGIVEAFGSLAYKIVEIGGQLIEGLWEGIKNAGEWLWDQISGFFSGIVDGIAGFLGIASPSKVFAEMGGYMAEGIGVGFSNSMSKVSKDMQKAIPTSFDTDIGVSAGIGGSGSSIGINVPLSLDGVVVTRATSRIQYNRNKTYSRALGVTV